MSVAFSPHVREAWSGFHWRVIAASRSHCKLHRSALSLNFAFSLLTGLSFVVIEKAKQLRTRKSIRDEEQIGVGLLVGFIHLKLKFCFAATCSGRELLISFS